MIAFQISLKIESLYGLGRQAKKLQGFVWNFATFARLPFGQFSTENSQKIDWVAFHSAIFQLRCLDFQSNQYKKLVLFLSRFCNGLLLIRVISKLNMSKIWSSLVTDKH